MTNCMRKCTKVSEGKEDRISNLPSEIIDHILDYMSLRDAAKTSILSWKWRNFWPMHSQLIFDEHCFSLINHMDKIIYTILLHHMGPIVKFFLDMTCINSPQYSDVDQWMFFLSRNGVRELSLLHSKLNGVLYQLPSCVFSCASLEHLTLHHVVIKLPSCLLLGNLTSLSFKYVKFVQNPSTAYSSSLSTPQLKKLSVERCSLCQLEIVAPLLEIAIFYLSIVTLLDHAIPNVKELKYSSCREVTRVTRPHPYNPISEIFKRFTNVWSLLLDGFFLKLLAVGTTAPIQLPRAVESIEHLTLTGLNFTDLDQISMVICLLEGCPNLRFLDLEASPRKKINEGDGVLNYLKSPNCIKQNLLKLRTVRICLFKNPIEELILLKVLLARCPSLDKVLIEESCSIDPVETSRIARTLLEFSRASTNAKIIWNQCKSS